MNNDMRCGFVAIVGRPNVGKSTLLNRLLGQKLSITSRKPQTTRHQILGINTRADAQIIYVDTPGLHRKSKNALNKLMNDTARQAMSDVDTVIFVIEAGQWTDEDELVLKQLQHANCPIILAVNKVDQLKDKAKLLPYLQSVSEKRHFDAILPISAKTGINVRDLEEEACQYLPNNPLFYPEDQLTDRSVRFIMAEFVREKLFRLTGDELPYATTVTIEKFVEEPKIYRIAALVIVERDSHKRIIIGKNGAKLKMIGQAAREEMERFLERKVFLQIWVKVKSGWTDSNRLLDDLGYNDD